jgi:hypothetical protein
MEFLQRLFIEPFERFADNLLLFLPKFLTALVILLAGLLLGGLFKILFARIFRTIGLDRLCRRAGLEQMLSRSGIRDPISLLIARIIGGTTVAVFAVIAVQTISVPAVERLLERFFLYLPNVFVALLILIVGYLLGNFLGRAALIAAVNAGIRLSCLIGRFVRYLVLILSVTMALEHLGIGRDTVLIAFTILSSGVVLAFAIAFGLGGRDAAREYLEKKLKFDEQEDEIHHL